MPNQSRIPHDKGKVQNEGHRMQMEMVPTPKVRVLVFLVDIAALHWWALLKERRVSSLASSLRETVICEYADASVD
jgi:hypothetical protein